MRCLQVFLEEQGEMRRSEWGLGEWRFVSGLGAGVKSPLKGSERGELGLRGSLDVFQPEY